MASAIAGEEDIFFDDDLDAVLVLLDKESQAERDNLNVLLEEMVSTEGFVCDQCC